MTLARLSGFAAKLWVIARAEDTLTVAASLLPGHRGANRPLTRRLTLEWFCRCACARGIWPVYGNEARCQHENIAGSLSLFMLSAISMGGRTSQGNTVIAPASPLPERNGLRPYLNFALSSSGYSFLGFLRLFGRSPRSGSYIRLSLSNW